MQSCSHRCQTNCNMQSYEIKYPPWTILWFRVLGIFSVENIDRLGAMMFQTSDNSQLCIDSQYSSQQLTIVWSLGTHQSTQPILIFSRVRILHLKRLENVTWFHSFDWTNLTLAITLKVNLSVSVTTYIKKRFILAKICWNHAACIKGKHPICWGI